jgi:hypothetical protein
MLTERMRAVVEQVERLDEEEQDALAAAIQAELDEDRRWEAVMDDPHDLVLDHLIAEAKEQVARGEVHDLDDLL